MYSWGQMSLSTLVNEQIQRSTLTGRRVSSYWGGEGKQTFCGNNRPPPPPPPTIILDFVETTINEYLFVLCIINKYDGKKGEKVHIIMGGREGRCI